MSGHEQFAEDLALYAIGVLEGEERTNLEEHLAGCAACRLELEQLRGDGALLALSTVGPKPPQRSRQRFLDAVAREATGPALARRASISSLSRAEREKGGAPVLPQRPWWGIAGWAVAAVAVVFATLQWRDNAGLRRDIFTYRAKLDQEELELGRAQDIVATLTATDAMRVTLVAVKTSPQPQGKAFYMRNRSSLVFLANNIPPPPAQKAYELWLIPTQGGPIPAGVFKPDVHGSASVINPPLPAGREAKAFAITVENESGSSTPTMPIVMMGTGE